MDNFNSGQPLSGIINSGEVAQPSGAARIMENMFSEMVSPEDIGKPPPQNNTPPIQNNTPPQNTAPVQNNSIVLNEPKKDQVTIEEPKFDLFTSEEAETPKEAAPESETDQEPDMSDIPDEPAKENWKKAREALRTERKTIKTLTKDFEATKKQLEKYEKGEIVPEIITAKDTRIAELEKFEVIVNGKLSDEYQTLVAEPVRQLNTSLNKLAEDYGVSEDIRGALLQKIVETDNVKERNQLITKYFPDAIGASRVESIVKELHDKGQIALDLDKKPIETMQTLQAQYQEKKEKESQVIASQFESVSKSAWTKALEKTAGEKLFPELILDPTNAEHSKIAEKNQHRAAIQYGALVKKLRENGLKNLPEDLAVGLARSIQLSIGSVGVAKQLSEALNTIEQMKSSNGMIARYMRPGVNGNGTTRTSAAPVNDKGPSSPKEAGDAALAFFKK